MLLPGKGIEVAADRFERAGDVGAPHVPRPLEHGMFEKMGEAVVLGILVPRTDVDPHADGDRMDIRHFLGEDPQAVRENGLPHDGIGLSIPDLHLFAV